MSRTTVMIGLVTLFFVSALASCDEPSGSRECDDLEAWPDESFDQWVPLEHSSGSSSQEELHAVLLKYDAVPDPWDYLNEAAPRELTTEESDVPREELDKRSRATVPTVWDSEYAADEEESDESSAADKIQAILDYLDRAGPVRQAQWGVAAEPEPEPSPPPPKPPAFTDITFEYLTETFIDSETNHTKTAVFPMPCECDGARLIGSSLQSPTCRQQHCLQEDNTTVIRRFFAHYRVRLQKLQLAFEDAMITRHENDSTPSNLTITMIAELSQESSDVFYSLWHDVHSPMIQRYVPIPCYWDIFALSCMTAMYSNLQMDFYMGQYRRKLQSAGLEFKPMEYVYCRVAVPEVDRVILEYERNASRGLLPAFVEGATTTSNWYPVPWLRIGAYFTALYTDCAHSYRKQHPFKDSDDLGLSDPRLSEAQKTRFRQYRQYIVAEQLKKDQGQPSFFDKEERAKVRKVQAKQKVKKKKVKRKRKARRDM